MKRMKLEIKRDNRTSSMPSRVMSHVYSRRNPPHMGLRRRTAGRRRASFCAPSRNGGSQLQQERVSGPFFCATGIELHAVESILCRAKPTRRPIRPMMRTKASTRCAVESPIQSNSAIGPPLLGSYPDVAARARVARRLIRSSARSSSAAWRGRSARPPATIRWPSTRCSSNGPTTIASRNSCRPSPIGWPGRSEVARSSCAPNRPTGTGCAIQVVDQTGVTPTEAEFVPFRGFRR